MSSTLATGGPPIFSLGQGASEDKYGLNVSAAATGGTTVAQSDPSTVPSTGFEVSVDVTPSPTATSLYYGIGCLGNATQNEQYEGLTDSRGDWFIEQENGPNATPTVLAQGTTSMSGGDSVLGLVCAPVPGSTDQTRISLAVDGTVVDTVDETSATIASGSGFTLDVTNSQSSPGGGTVRFHTLVVHGASAE